MGAILVGGLIGWYRLKMYWLIIAAIGFAIFGTAMFASRIRPWQLELGLTPASVEEYALRSMLIALISVGIGFGTGLALRVWRENRSARKNKMTKEPKSNESEDRS